MPREHHATLPPSSFPMLAECPRYRSGEVGEAAERGHLQHAALEAMLRASLAGGEIAADHPALQAVTAEESEQVSWAAGYVRTYFGRDVLVEERLSLLGEDFAEVTFGTADAIALTTTQHGDTLNLADYKSGQERDYKPQMAVYALMAMDRYGRNRCRVHELYGRNQWAKKYDIDREEAERLVWGIVREVLKDESPPRVCGYCGWCARQGTCDAAVRALTTVATEYDDFAPGKTLDLSKVTTWHSSRITDPEQASIVFQVAEYLGKWSEAAKANITKLAASGVEIPGYEMRSGSNRRSFADDLNAVYAASGLTDAEFLACCKASVPDVEKAVAAKLGVSAKSKDGKKAFAERLGALVNSKESAPSLARIKG